MTTLATNELEKTAVKYIKVKKALDQLQDALKPLSEAIKESGVSCIETSLGNIHVLTANRTTLDMKAVIDKLGQAWVTKHSKITEYPYIRMSK